MRKSAKKIIRKTARKTAKKPAKAVKKKPTKTRRPLRKSLSPRLAAVVPPQTFGSPGAYSPPADDRLYNAVTFWTGIPAILTTTEN